jgi:pyocin large subunit-like protein
MLAGRMANRPIATAFANPAKRADHWKSHRKEFNELGIVDEIEYEKKAAEFLNAPLTESMLECVRRRDGDIIRFDRSTEIYAAMRADGVIRTFFRPTREWHGLPSNLAYFQRECLK